MSDEEARIAHLRNKQITIILEANKIHADDRAHGVDEYKPEIESQTKHL